MLGNAVRCHRRVGFSLEGGPRLAGDWAEIAESKSGEVVWRVRVCVALKQTTSPVVDIKSRSLKDF